ncbi:hypothetical protein BJ165DRAFT_1534340 [Panaeolus papilionaceus]|nr:hypothetical protein BJ165DRAFT_1534340 [Panaeolus papilionaceus]
MEDTAPIPSIPEIVQGTMQQLIDNAALGSNGKVLNALDLLHPQALSVPDMLASDSISWEAMTIANDLSNFMPYPNSNVNWYLAELEGALTFFHLDNDEGDVDIKIVVLCPGDGIIMGPNTFHFTGTVENAICQGFYFYSSILILQACAGLINMFILNHLLANTHHNASWSVLLHMFTFNFTAHFERLFIDHKMYYHSHLLDISIWEGVAGLITLCTLVILINALDFRTYLGLNQAEDQLPTEQQHIELESYDFNYSLARAYDYVL